MLPILLLAIPLIIMSLAYGMISITLWSGMKLDQKSEMGKKNIHEFRYKCVFVHCMLNFEMYQDFVFKGFLKVQISIIYTHHKALNYRYTCIKKMS